MYQLPWNFLFEDSYAIIWYALYTELLSKILMRSPLYISFFIRYHTRFVQKGARFDSKGMKRLTHEFSFIDSKTLLRNKRKNFSFISSQT